MNIHQEEFLDALTDILSSLKMNGVSQADHGAIMSLDFGLMQEVQAP